MRGSLPFGSVALAVLVVACSGGEAPDTTSQRPPADGARDAGPTHDQTDAGLGAPATEGEDAPSNVPREAAFYVLQPLPNSLVNDGDDPEWLQAYIELFGGAGADLYGISSVVVTDPAGVRIGAQIFRWSPGGEAVTLDDNTPWKQMHFAAEDRRFVVGARGTGAGSAQAFVWSEIDGVQEIAIGDSRPVLVHGTSADGRVVVGDGRSEGNWRAYRWTAADGAKFIDLPEGRLASGSASVSADGNTMYGSVSSSGVPSQCFRWRVSAGTEILDDVPDANGWDSGGCGVTRRQAADGSVTGGTRSYTDPEAPTSRARWEAFHWSEADGVSTIELLDGYGHADAFETNSDGKVIYGQTWIDNSTTSGEQSFRWTAETGTTALGIPAGASAAELLAADQRNRSGISDDGKTVAGNAVRGKRQGFIWSLDTGLVGLESLPGHESTKVTHLSASGRVAAGLSTGANVEAFLLGLLARPRKRAQAAPRGHVWPRRHRARLRNRLLLWVDGTSRCTRGRHRQLRASTGHCPQARRAAPRRSHAAPRQRGEGAPS